MTGVLLVGASGLAREVAAAAADRWPVTGLLDDDPALRGTRVGGLPVLGGIELAAARSERLLLCIGPGRGRWVVADRLAGLGVAEDRYTTFVHPSAVVSPGCTVGAGSILLAGVVLTAEVTVGRHVVAMPHVTLTHDDVVEDFATLAAGVSLGGGVRVGRGAYLGMNSSVRQRIAIGDRAVVGMGAAVVADVPPGETWAGVPGRPLRAGVGA